jgi:hypothetical protein
MSDVYFDERMETLPPDVLRKVQDHRLRWQFRRGWDGSPFYRSRFEAAGLTRETFGGLADLGSLPLLVREELDSTDAAAWQTAPDDWIQVWQRTDAEGFRRVTWGDLIHVTDRYARGEWAIGSRFERSGGLTQSQIHPFLNSPVRRNFAPVLGGPRTAPRRDLNLPVVGFGLAYRCQERQGFHWPGDQMLAEVVKQDGREVSERDLPGELVVTDLVREASPLIRYRTGLVRVLTEDPCACGRTGPRLWSVSEHRRWRRSQVFLAG